MKKLVTALALSLALAIPSQAALSPEDETSIKDVQRETRELIESIKSYTAEQRDQAIQEIEVAIVRLDQRIDALQYRIDNRWDGMTEAAREEARSSLDDLRRQRQELAGWYNDLKNSSASAWADIRKGFSKAYRSINKAWEKALNEFGGSETAS